MGGGDGGKDYDDDGMDDGDDGMDDDVDGGDGMDDDDDDVDGDDGVAGSRIQTNYLQSLCYQTTVVLHIQNLSYLNHCLGNFLRNT